MGAAVRRRPRHRLGSRARPPAAARPGTRSRADRTTPSPSRTRQVPGVVNTCQISVVKNMTSEKNSSSGTARTSTEIADARTAKNRAPAHRTIETMPKPITRYTSNAGPRVHEHVLKPNRNCPLNTIGSRPAAPRTRRARAAHPRGHRQERAPRTTFSSPNATTSIARPADAEQQVLPTRFERRSRHHLEQEHQREERDRRGEHVLGRGEVDDQVGQAVTAEAALELARCAASSPRRHRTTPRSGGTGASSRPARLDPMEERSSERGRAVRPPRRRRVHVRRHDREVDPRGVRGALRRVHRRLGGLERARARRREQVAPIREREQRAAADVLGVKSVTFLGETDGLLEVTPGPARRSPARSAGCRPRCRGARSLAALVGPGYVNHWDHKQAGLLALPRSCPMPRPG